MTNVHSFTCHIHPYFLLLLLLRSSLLFHSVFPPHLYHIHSYHNTLCDTGFSLQTPIVSGQLRTSRYYPYYRRAMAKLKTLLKKGFYNANNVLETLCVDKLERIEKTANIEEVLKIVGKDFYVVLPCPSVKVKGAVFEGTRLTLVAHAPEGIEFTIRTPGFPVRWKQYEVELEHSFQKLVDTLSAIYDTTLSQSQSHANSNGTSSENVSPKSDDSQGTECTSATSVESPNCKNTQWSLDSGDLSPKGPIGHHSVVASAGAGPTTAPSHQAAPVQALSPRHSQVLRIALELFYFWTNFSPLTRGAAACGYSCLVAVMLSCGMSFAEPLPANMQLDWEALFSESCEEFVNRMVPLLPIVKAPTGIDLAPSVDDHILTFRDMIQALL
jgi:hypothetical protein